MSGNENSIIEDILKYMFPTNVEPVREMMIAKVAALSQYYIGGCDTETKIVLKGDKSFYSTGIDRITLDEKLFLDPKNFGNDISKIAHECCHQVDFNLIGDSKYISDAARFSEKCRAGIMEVMRKAMTKQGLYKGLDIDKYRWGKIEPSVSRYLFLKNLDTSQERAARQFSIDMLTKIVDYWENNSENISKNSRVYIVMNRNAQRLADYLEQSRNRERIREKDIQAMTEEDLMYLRGAKILREYFTTQSDGQPSLMHQICQMDARKYKRLEEKNGNPVDDMYHLLMFARNDDFAMELIDEITTAKECQREGNLRTVDKILDCMGWDNDNNMKQRIESNVRYARDREAGDE